MQTIQTPSTVQIAQPVGERRRQVIASLLGQPSFEFIEWRKLIQDGVLVRLHVRRCRFSVRLTLDDIGVRVENDDVREKLAKWLVLGEKRLLPEAYMKSLARIESGARYALKERAFRTELGAFVPSTAYIAWRETTQSLRTQYFALRDEIIANHRTLVRQVLSEYEVIAADTYQRLHGTHPELITESQEQFVATYCNRIASQIPTPERIRETFDFKYILVDGLSQLGTTPTENATEFNQTESSEVVSVDAVRSQIQQREWQRSVLENDLRTHAQERVNVALDSFLSSIVGQLRSLTYDAACDVLSTLQRRSGESLSPRSIMQLNNLLTQVRSLNFYGDTDMERIMAQVQQIVEQSPTERQTSLADIQRTLRAVATVTRAELLDLEEEPRVARSIAIPDFPTDSSVRQARAELGLDLDELQFSTLSQVRTDVRAERAEVAITGMESLWNFVEREPQREARLV